MMRGLFLFVLLLFGCTAFSQSSKPHGVYYLLDYPDSLQDRRPGLSLTVVLHLDSDSLVGRYRKYFAVWENPRIRITISKTAAFDNIDFTDTPDTLKRLLNKKFEKLNYPCLLVGTKQDTLAYTLLLDLRHTRAKQRAAMLLVLDANTKHQIKSFIRFSPEEKFISGDLFHTKELLAITSLPVNPEFFLLRKENGRWQAIDSIVVSVCDLYWYDRRDLIDLDLDGLPEFVIETPPNMNGNQWFHLLRCDTATHRLRYAGAFNTGYEIDTLRKEIHVTYTGSWYMPVSQTIYRWNKGVLLPWKKIESAYRDAFANNGGERIVTLYENPEWKNGKDTLVAVRTEKETHSAKQQQEWDDFFK